MSHTGIQPPSIAILSFSAVARDARVLRQIHYLARHFPLTVIGYGTPGSLPASVKYRGVHQPSGIGPGRKLRTLLLLPLGRLLPAQAYEAWYWNRSDRQAMLRCLLDSPPQFIHANDWDTLPIAARVAQEEQAKIVLDLHEYSPSQYRAQSYRGMFFNRMADYFLRAYAPKTVRSVTVNHTIAEKYKRAYGLDPSVVMNAPRYDPSIGFRPVDDDQIHLVHHGAAVRSRRLGLLIKTLARTDSRYKLHFLLTNPQSRYVSRLKQLAQREAPERVCFHPAVRPDQIVDRIAQYDMGFYLLPPTCFNQAAALPNKFFDFISAGLAVCTGPSDEMAKLTHQHGFGVVTSDFTPESAARTLNGLSPDKINEMKRCAVRSRKALNADVEMAKLVRLYTDLMNSHDCESRR